MSVEQSVELKRQGKAKYSQKTWPSFTLSTTNPTCRDGKPATDRLSWNTNATSLRTVTALVGTLDPSDTATGFLCDPAATSGYTASKVTVIGG
jgi:hypothetical protein